MSESILGISAFYHDSAAAIVFDGEIIGAAQEERFSRRKHDPRFPKQAINFCLAEAFIEIDELDAVVFYDQPLLTLDRVLKSILSVAPAAEAQWVQAAASVLGVKLFVAQYIRRALGADDDLPVYFTRHHIAHAASAFYPSPFSEAAILTLDGVGEWATTSLAVGRDREIETLAEIHYPHSLGLLYSAFTSFCGFKVNSGEYKLMGLAPYGQPRFADRIRQHLLHQKGDGSFRLATDYFGFLDGDRMTNERFDDLFEGPPRQAEGRITRREMDLAASIQKVTEEAVLGLARHLRQVSGMSDLCLAGGVALNCVANGILQREKVFDRLWIQPAAGDAGGALGAALYASHQHFEDPRKLRKDGGDSQRGSYLGPSFSAAEIRAFLNRQDYPHRAFRDPQVRLDEIAKDLAFGKVVGFFSGRMEFGPRALGARSILADPRQAETQTQLNMKIKYRESFRPFAPSVLADQADEYFDLDVESPYMLLVAPVKEEHRKAIEPFFGDADDMLHTVRQTRSDIPAVTHVDYSARVQTVNAKEHPDFHAVLSTFEALTGCPVLVNTSFNVRGEPIVCSPEDAYRCFMRTEMDVLVLGDFVLVKEDQPPVPDDPSWRKEYELD